MMVTPKQIKRSVTIAGHRTSISLEGDFWDSLKEISRLKKLSVSQLVEQIDAQRLGANQSASTGPMSGLSSAIRVYILTFYKERAQDDVDAG